MIAELGDTSTAEASEPMPAVEHAAYVAPVADRVPPPAAEPTPPPVAEAAPPPPPEPAPRRVAEVVPPPPADVPAADPPVEAEPAPPLPRHAAAPKAKEPRRSAVPTGGPGSFNGERISLDFKDADIQNVLRVLADVSHLNIIATDDVKGKVTLHLVDVPWDQALDLVLRSNRLEMTRQGNVVRISTVARLKEEREALRAAEDAERELEPLRVKYVKVNYARADDSLLDKVKGVLSERGSVTFDDRTNTIIVRDIPHGLQDAAELIRELDTQSPQVLIEANIVEATEDFARGLGVQWGYRFNAGPATGNPTGANFPGTVGLGGSGLGSGAPSPGLNGAPGSSVPFLADFPVPGNFGSGFGANNGSAIDLALGSLSGSQSLTARLTALEEQGKGRVVSRPRVITMNNVAATIQSLTILRVKLPSTGTVINTGTGGAAGSASTATEKINTGITLVVTPQVSQDGFVLMSIYAKSSQPDFTHTVDNIPNEVSREANSNVLIKDGETVVLGGIYRNTSNDAESGLPYLSRIPALGWLFKRLLRTHHHEELLVFLTPKVMATGAVALPPAERLWEERRQGG
ncbi:MAG: type IV pilus secretin PilQ [Deltaproteobacteria bacterium]|nr:MAG: type IV pilus secretin PilQ [Deltaproteobacteria bacterium]